MMFAVPAALLQSVAEYLTKQPYRDVQGLLTNLLACRPVETPPPPEPGAKS